MRLLAVILNMALLGSVVGWLLVRVKWEDLTPAWWANTCLLLSCPIVNLIVLRETVIGWFLDIVQKASEVGQRPKGSRGRKQD